MNYSYEEWKSIKQKGLIKFIFDANNLILIFLLIAVFAIANLLIRKAPIPSKEFLIHFAIIIVVLIILWILSQLIKWSAYKNVFEVYSKKKYILIRLYEILIGVLNLWIPIGILTSTYGIDYVSTFWKINHLDFNYILRFVEYISIKSILWVVGGILFELMIINSDRNYNRKNYEGFIIINKYI